MLPTISQPLPVRPPAGGQRLLHPVQHPAAPRPDQPGWDIAVWIDQPQDNYKTAAAAFDAADPHRIFSNTFLDTLLP